MATKININFQPDVIIPQAAIAQIQLPNPFFFNVTLKTVYCIPYDIIPFAQTI